METQADTSSAKADKLNVLCGICSEFYNSNDIIFSTSSCGHVFHKNCLYRWLRQSRSCPQCRAACHLQRVHRIYLNFTERTQDDNADKAERTLHIQWIPIDLDDPAVAIELEGAVQCGTDHDGLQTYVARAYLNDDLLPANYVPQKKKVYAPWNCQAHTLENNIDLLVLTDCEIKWVPASDGFVPHNALETGYSELNETLYTGRSTYGDHTLLGKVHPSHRVLYMPHHDNEVNSKDYEVLVVTPKEQADR